MSERVRRSEATFNVVSCTKIYRDIPIAHRSPNHDGHCRFIHGHNWDFHFTFECHEKDENGFVFDFGKLEPLKRAIADFDHGLAINKNDPLARDLKSFLGEHQIGNVILVEDCSTEGFAQMFLDVADDIVKELSSGRAWCSGCTVYEDSKNSASAIKMITEIVSADDHDIRIEVDTARLPVFDYDEREEVTK